MQVKILKEAGYEEALMGMAFSYKDRALEPLDWWKGQKEKAISRSVKLVPLGPSHAKFLRQIMVWMIIEAPRSFWSEFDTYKVGTVANSESTMHTLAKRKPTYDDFEEGTSQKTMDCFIEQWEELKSDITKLKENLPEGYLQRRMVTMNYEVIRNIFHQREGHRYKRWGKFIEQVTEQLEHKEFLTQGE